MKRSMIAAAILTVAAPVGAVALTATPALADVTVYDGNDRGWTDGPENAYTVDHECDGHQARLLTWFHKDGPTHVLIASNGCNGPASHVAYPSSYPNPWKEQECEYEVNVGYLHCGTAELTGWSSGA